MVPLAALLSEQGHRVTGTRPRALSPRCRRLLAAPGDPGRPRATRPNTSRRTRSGHRRQRRPAGQRRGGRGRPGAASRLSRCRRRSGEYLLPGKTSVVITGTHGKTTTSALTAWLLSTPAATRASSSAASSRTSAEDTGSAGARTSSSRATSTTRRSSTAGRSSSTTSRSSSSSGTSSTTTPTSTRTSASIEEAFRQVAALVPPTASSSINADDPRVVDVVRAFGDTRDGRPRSRSRTSAADFSARDLEQRRRGNRFHALERGVPAARLSSPLLGTHNVRNALGAIALARGRGLSVAEIARSLPRFAGVRRRLEVQGREERHHRRRRLRAPSHGRREHASRPRAPACRAAGSGRSSSRARTPPAARCSRRSTPTRSPRADALVLAPVFHARASAPRTRASTATRSCDASRAAESPPSLPRRSPRSPEIIRREARPGDVLLLDVLGRLRRTAGDAARSSLDGIDPSAIASTRGEDGVMRSRFLVVRSAV